MMLTITLSIASLTFASIPENLQWVDVWASNLTGEVLLGRCACLIRKWSKTIRSVAVCSILLALFSSPEVFQASPAVRLRDLEHSCGLPPPRLCFDRVSC